jgi:hypothetical protein
LAAHVSVQIGQPLYFENCVLLSPEHFGYTGFSSRGTSGPRNWSTRTMA